MKKILFLSVVLALGLAFQSQAANTNSNQKEKAEKPEAQAQKALLTSNATKTEEKNKVANQGAKTQVQTQEKNEIKVMDKDGVKKDEIEKINSELHRSVVANFVQSLLSIADREKGIGQQVRVIAQQQNDSKENVVATIEKVEKRSKLKDFLIGTDYKNLGQLRSEMVQTENQIRQLTELLGKASSEQSKAELQTQIQVLEQERVNVNNFIAQNENKFSLLGWAVKLFQ